MRKVVSYFILYLCLQIVLNLKCLGPQRIGLLSFNALSQREQLTKLFDKISTDSKAYNTSFTDTDGLTYTLTDFKPTILYNDYKQNETFLTSQTANVDCGLTTLVFNSGYTVTNGTVKKASGVFSGKVNFDDYSFTKAIDVTRGEISWKTLAVKQLYISQTIFIEGSHPKLEYNHKVAFENIINGLSGDFGLKERMLTNINRIYIPYLEEFLNDEDIMATTNTTYTYKGKDIVYLNYISDIQLVNKSTYSGLEYQFLFELEGYTEKCDFVPTTFDPKYGGNQEYLPLQLLRSTILYGLRNGMLNAQLSRAWEVEIFQFYMGDVANFISYAQNQTPDTPLKGSCVWNNSLYDLSVDYHQDNRVFANIPYTCELKINSTQELIQRIHFSISLVVDLILTNEELHTKISTTNTFGAKFESVGQYVVTNTNLASYVLKSVVKSLLGSSTIGHGFPMLYRKKPSLFANGDYLHFYDASEK